MPGINQRFQLVSPIGDQLTLDFSKSLIVSEQLGKDAFPDYLSISFSAVDAVNHFFRALQSGERRRGTATGSYLG